MHAALTRLTLVLFAALAAGVAHAQAPALERVELTLWPEYDQPALLVMIKATLPADTPLPAEARLTIPAAVGAPHAVAYRDPATGNLMLAHHVTTVEGEWQHLDIAAPSTSLRVEYYAPIAADEEARAFSVAWPGTAAVGELVYDLQQPAGADHLTVTPEPTMTVMEETLAYHRGSFGALAAGQTAELQVAYDKTDPRLTVQILQPQPPAAAAAPPPPPAQPAAPAPAPPRTSAPDSSLDATMWTSIAIGLLLLGALVALAWSWIRKRT